MPKSALPEAVRGLLDEIVRIAHAVIPYRELLPPLQPAGAYETAAALGLVVAWDRPDGSFATLTPLGQQLAGAELVEPVEPIGDDETARWEVESPAPERRRGEVPFPRPRRPALRTARFASAGRLGFSLLDPDAATWDPVLDSEGRVVSDSHGQPAWRRKRRPVRGSGYPRGMASPPSGAGR